MLIAWEDGCSSIVRNSGRDAQSSPLAKAEVKLALVLDDLVRDPGTVVQDSRCSSDPVVGKLRSAL